jgi:hypothetical protein
VGVHFPTGEFPNLKNGIAATSVAHGNYKIISLSLCLCTFCPADEVDAMLGKRGNGTEHEASLQVKTGATVGKY